MSGMSPKGVLVALEMNDALVKARKERDALILMLQRQTCPVCTIHLSYVTIKGCENCREARTLLRRVDEAALAGGK